MGKGTLNEVAKALMIDYYAMFFRILKTKREITTKEMFGRVTRIAAKYKDVDSVMNVSWKNGKIEKGICIITDWKNFAIVWQSNDGEIPTMERVVTAEEYEDFMKEVKPILEIQYLPTQEPPIEVEEAEGIITDILKKAFSNK